MRRLLPPWRFRFAPPEPDQSVRAAVGLIKERDQLAAERDLANLQRDNARGELAVAMRDLGQAQARIFELLAQLADARRQMGATP